MLDINISTPTAVMDKLKGKYKDLRLSFDFTQAGLAQRSGVSLGSIKRFECSGQISLESLIICIKMEYGNDDTKKLLI